MKEMFRSLFVLGLGVFLAGSVGFAQTSGAAIFKTNCQACHGPNGIPNPTMAKMLGVPAVTSPQMKVLTAQQMVTVVTNGKGKMPAWKGKLTDPQIKAVVAYLRTLIKK
jgi:cytochrome c6